MIDEQISPLGLVRGAEAQALIGAGLALALAPGLAFTRHARARRAGGAVHRDILPLDAAPGYTPPADPLAALGLPGERPLVMGIVNVTPDSFSDGGRFQGAAGVQHAERLVAAGADILDIGGESTRPGSAEVSVQEEIDRVCPVIAAAAPFGVPVSVDTRKAAVMQAALAAGATIVNDVSALAFDPAAAPYLATIGCPVILMHTRGTPQTMQQDPRYGDVLFEVVAELASSCALAQAAGIDRGRLIVDPGIGFAKTVAHNLALIDGLHALHALRLPILLGVSRKSFIGRLNGDIPADGRLPGSLAAAMAGLDRGARILRVHDVAETVQAVTIWRALSVL
ncbi:dihydropteroate synthase [Oleomonas cavernae]|uniref:Dihydropteroate synthase n=1 Tax=Oleomonas cavernae TaxID=2320859 RepID=A0A418VUC1_9PROT|nr:dihydropteroate synthase [Oleomonas cavernae]RJF80746.1 dihydropteroate synthase [Oleomonas cavernae]